jgi:hypothetical protein
MLVRTSDNQKFVPLIYKYLDKVISAKIRFLPTLSHTWKKVAFEMLAA